MSFIRLKVRAAFMVHGYDADNREIVEQIGEERFVEKLLRIERIQSISEKYCWSAPPTGASPTGNTRAA